LIVLVFNYSFFPCYPWHSREIKQAVNAGLIFTAIIYEIRQSMLFLSLFLLPSLLLPPSHYFFLRSLVEKDDYVDYLGSTTSKKLATYDSLTHSFFEIVKIKIKGFIFVINVTIFLN
jgi:hypothetical protein